MIDAILGSVIMVAATGALVLLIQVSELAISPAPRPCNEYEKKVVVSAARGMSYAQAVDECNKVANWMRDRRAAR